MGKNAKRRRESKDAVRDMRHGAVASSAAPPAASIACYVCGRLVRQEDTDWTPFRIGEPGSYEMEIAHRACVDALSLKLVAEGGRVDVTTDRGEIDRLIGDPNWQPPEPGPPELRA